MSEMINVNFDGYAICFSGEDECFKAEIFYGTTNKDMKVVKGTSIEQVIELAVDFLFEWSEYLCEKYNFNFKKAYKIIQTRFE